MWKFSRGVGLGLVAILFSLGSSAAALDRLDNQADGSASKQPIEIQKSQNQTTSKNATHVLRAVTVYYLDGPQQARPNDGSLPVGTRVTLMRDAGSYSQIQTDQGVVAYVASDALDAIPPQPTVRQENECCRRRRARRCARRGC